MRETTNHKPQHDKQRVHFLLRRSKLVGLMKYERPCGKKDIALTLTLSPRRGDFEPNPLFTTQEQSTPSPSRERAGVRGWMNNPYLRLRYFSRNSSGYSRRWDILRSRAGGGANREIGRAEYEPLPFRPTRFNKTVDELWRRGHR